MFIFLDFDGVLRRKQSPLYRFDQDCLMLFEGAMRALPELKIVITSSWREAFSLAEMRRLFSPDIAARIVGTTPKSSSSADFTRHREVLAWLNWWGYENAPWLAIDDDPLNYPPRLKNLLLIDACRGFDPKAAASLIIFPTL
jgi:hypothetical protein